MAIKEIKSDEQVQDNSLTSPNAKGERLRRVRHLANLSREEFCSDGKTSIGTLISWEIGRFGGLSAKGAARVISRVAEEGVFCTPEWLLYEIGVGPEVRADYKKARVQAESIDEDYSLPDSSTVIEELLLFKKLNKHSTDFLIEDDAMLPHYQIGDYVAGVKRFGTKIASLVGLDCIVQTTDGRIFVRNLQQGPKVNSYNLVASHFKTRVKEAIVYDVEVLAAAPIVWHRRKEPLQVLDL